jgi:exodeoxyribonuclease VII large subunit
VDVAILARGGGSLEDLHAFNSEDVARAVFRSTIPIVSAVGHETDITIADFVSDMRAPTPSAAAELVIPSKEDLRFGIEKLSAELTNVLKQYIERCRALLTEKSLRLVDPRRKISDLRLRTDDYTDRIVRLILNTIHQIRERLVWRTEQLFSNSPRKYIDKLNQKLDKNTDNLLNLLNSYFVEKQFMLRVTTAKLAALNPKAILDRGYSITRTIPAGALVRDSRAVQIGQDLEVLVAKGSLRCRVKRKFEDGSKNVRSGDEAA